MSLLNRLTLRKLLDAEIFELSSPAFNKRLICIQAVLLFHIGYLNTIVSKAQSYFLPQLHKVYRPPALYCLFAGSQDELHSIHPCKGVHTLQLYRNGANGKRSQPSRLVLYVSLSGGPVAQLCVLSSGVARPKFKMRQIPLEVKKKVKASHTRHRALGPQLIPVYRQSACR